MDKEMELVIEEYRKKLVQAREEIDQAQKKGIEIGVRLMQERMLLACENGTPIAIKGKGYWVQSDIEHLRVVMNSIK